MKKNSITFLLIFLTFLVRIGYLSIAIERDKFYTNDEPGYDQMAKNLLAGKGFRTREPVMLISNSKPTAMREPLYILFLAFSYKLFNNDYYVVRILQVFLDCITSLFIYLISMKIFQEKKIAWLSMFIFAVYIPEVIFSAHISQAVLYSLFLSVSIFLILKAFENPIFMRFLICGASLGLSSLCKGTVEFFITFLIILVAILLYPKWKLILKFSLGLILGFFIVLSPWVIRNYFVFKAFVPTSTAGGYNFFIGNHFETGGAAFHLAKDMIDESLKRQLMNSDEHQQDLIYCRETIKRIRQKPDAFLILCFKKLTRFWLNLGYGRTPSIKSLFVAGENIILFSFILLFLIYGDKTYLLKALPLIMMITYFTLFHMLVVAGVHYFFPISPFVIILATPGIVIVLKKLGYRISDGTFH